MHLPNQELSVASKQAHTNIGNCVQKKKKKAGRNTTHMYIGKQPHSLADLVSKACINAKVALYIPTKQTSNIHMGKFAKNYVHNNITKTSYASSPCPHVEGLICPPRSHHHHLSFMYLLPCLQPPPPWGSTDRREKVSKHVTGRGSSGCDQEEPEAKAGPGRHRALGRGQESRAKRSWAGGQSSGQQPVPPQRPVGHPRRACDGSRREGGNVGCAGTVVWNQRLCSVRRKEDVRDYLQN